MTDLAAAWLTNFLFWSGVAVGGVAFAALLELTGATWAGPLRRVAEACRWFLPLSLLLYFGLLFAAPSVARPFVWRDAAALVAVYACAFWFCGVSSNSGDPTARRSATRRAIVFLVIYAFGFSLIAVDLVMSLEPQWESSLFPAYLFTGNVYAGIAASVLAGASIRRARPTMNDSRACDAGNLLLGFALLWGYLVWSQFLVIWYGNLTDEIAYVVLREPWRRTASATGLACGAIPFAIFLFQEGKRPRPVIVVSALILIGAWLERWLLVAPAVGSSSVLATIVVTVPCAIAFTTTVVFSVPRDVR